MKENEAIKNALELIAEYGYIDGESHKQWIIDQVVRMLTLCPTIKKEFKSQNDTLYYFDVLGKSEEYKEWIHSCEVDYTWNTGISP